MNKAGGDLCNTNNWGDLDRGLALGAHLNDHVSSTMEKVSSLKRDSGGLGELLDRERYILKHQSLVLFNAVMMH